MRAVAVLPLGHLRRRAQRVACPYASSAAERNDGSKRDTRTAPGFAVANVHVTMLLTGLLTPPVGLLSFVTSSATGISLDKVYSGVTPSG